MEDYVVFMPTRGRADVSLQHTLRNLTGEVKSNLLIVCHPGEEVFFEENYGDSVMGVISFEASHIGEVRQVCIDNSPSDNIIFVDDSLDFHVRADSDTGTVTNYPLKGMLPKHFTQSSINRYTNNMFRWIVSNLRSGKYGMVGISRRSSNNFNEMDYKLNERVCSFWGINRKLFNYLKGNPKFSDMQLKEDFYICLHFLTNAVKLITSYEYAYDRIGSANSKGGCSIYRNMDSHNKSAYDLHNTFPDFVKIREKSTKSWKEGFSEKSIDVTVYCKKAYEYGISNLK